MQLKSQDVFVGVFIIITSSVFRPLVSLRSIWWAAIARYGLHLYGHNRGSMIIQNAMGALHDDGAGDDVLAKTGVNFFEPAANAQKTAQRLNELSGGMQDTVILENHGYDFVGRVIGGNPATNYKIPDGSNALREFLKVFIPIGRSSHGCSGSDASPECKRDYGKYNPVILGPNGVK